jgi:hypothetical protein
MLAGQQGVSRTEPGAPVQRDGALARAQDDTGKTLTVRVAEHRLDEPGTDARLRYSGRTYAFAR